MKASSYKESDVFDLSKKCGEQREAIACLLGGPFGAAMCAALLLLLLPAPRCFAPPFSSCCHYCVCLRAASASGHAPVATAMSFVFLSCAKGSRDAKPLEEQAENEAQPNKAHVRCLYKDSSAPYNTHAFTVLHFRTSLLNLLPFPPR